MGTEGKGRWHSRLIPSLCDFPVVRASLISVYKTGTEQTVNDTVQEAKSKEVSTAELQLHSDQGANYFTLTQKYGITPSKPR